MKKAILAVVLFALVAQAMLLAQQATFVSLYTLLRDWDSNKIRVKELYHNKTIQTAGEVSIVNADGSIVLSVEAMELWAMSMLGAGLRTTSINVNFNSSERSKLANLYKEQFINITGVYDGDRNVINRAVIGTAPAATAQPTPAPNNTEQARTANERGLAFFNQSNWDSAITQFAEAIRLNANNATYYNNRAVAYHNKRDYDRAIADYTQAIRLDSKYADAYGNRANAYAAKSDWDRAIADYTQAIQLAPNEATYYGNRSFAYRDKGDIDREIADLTQAIRLAPNTAVYYNNRAAAYNNKRDYDRAITDATEAIRLDPNQANPYAHRANAYFQKGNYTQARADVNRCLQINPNQERAKNLDAELKRRGY